MSIRRRRQESALTREQVEAVASYCPLTGRFTWKRPHKGRIELGCIKSSGYQEIGICGARVYGHRLAWLFITGEWPAQEVDHINGVRADNRWCNLRAASDKANSENVKRRIDNKSGFRGVHWHKGRRKWVAQVSHNGRTKNLGLYADLHEAAAAAEAARSQLFTHVNEERSK